MRTLKEINKGCKNCTPPLIEFYNGSLFLVAEIVLCPKCSQEHKRTLKNLEVK